MNAACDLCRSLPATASRGTHNDHDIQTRKFCLDVDRPISALLTDLKQRRLLDEKLVLWVGEFGRTPTTENGNGRDHNHFGFTTWLAEASKVA